MDGDVGGEVFAQLVSHGADVNVHFARDGLRFRAAIDGNRCCVVIEELLGELFRGAHGEFAADDLIGRQQLTVMVLDGEHRFGVSYGELTLRDKNLNVLVKIEQTHGIRHAGTRFADAAGDFLLLHAKLAGQPHVAGCLFHRVEILALEVLDESHLKHISIGCFTLDDGYRGQPEFSGGAPAALAGDQFELAIHRPDDERLDDAMLSDRLNQIVKRGIHKAGARLQRAGDHQVMRHIPDAFEIFGGDGRLGNMRVGTLLDECSKTFTECLLRHGAASFTQSRGGFQAELPANRQGAHLTGARAAGIDGRVKTNAWLGALVAALLTAGGVLCAQQAQAPAVAPDEAQIVADPVPPEVERSAVEAVAKLGEQVVLGRYHMALERMNPLWKERTAARMGGMEALQRQLDAVAAEMVRQGVTMISFKPQGKPQVHQVGPGKKTIRDNGSTIERGVYTKWLVMVPTVTRFRILAEGNPRPMIIESTGFQVAISDKDRLDWTFIDGAGLTVADLRRLFITLPQDVELPPVGKREVK